MKKEEAMKLRNIVSDTIPDLISVTLDFERELVHVDIFGRITELPIAELDSRKNSCRDFIGYLKDKIGI